MGIHWLMQKQLKQVTMAKGDCRSKLIKSIDFRVPVWEREKESAGQEESLRTDIRTYWVSCRGSSSLPVDPLIMLLSDGSSLAPTHFGTSTPEINMYSITVGKKKKNKRTHILIIIDVKIQKHKDSLPCYFLEKQAYCSSTAELWRFWQLSSLLLLSF